MVNSMSSMKRYKDGPTIKKDEESGRPKVAKREEAADRVQEGMDGVKIEEKDGAGMPIHARHAMERRSLHHQHETEHAVHGDHDKKEMHKRHEKEMKDMHGRHEKEIPEGKGETGEKLIEKSKEKAE